jgi:hypothetical protein
VNLSFPAAKTSELRAAAGNDPNATDSEATINSIDLFIYGESGYYISHTPLSVADFTQVSTGGTADTYVYNAAAKIATTTGPKKLFVAVNLPSNVITALEHTTTSELTQVTKTFIRSQLIAFNGATAMSSSELVDCNFVKDADSPANHPTLTAKRMVAKITVQKDANMIQAGVPGRLDDLSFAVNNFNERSFFIQGAAPEYKDPNWNTYDPVEYSKAGANDYVLVNESGISNPKNLNALYASENTSQAHRMKEITRVTVRAAFLPEKVVEYSNGNYVTVTSASEGVTTPQTFYTVTLYHPNPETYCFFDRTTAENYALANGVPVNNVVCFSDGICYWDMFLNKNDKNNIWDVLRNDYYQCTIKRILAPGRPSDDLTDPEDPPAVDTDITINMEVLFWNNPKLDDYELEP